MEEGKFGFIDGWIKIINYEIYNRFIGEKNEKAKEKELALIPIKIKEYTYPIDRVSPKRDTPYSGNHNKLVINNGISNQKEKKNKYMDAVFLTKDEYKKLIDKFGEGITKDKIEELNNYIKSKGKEKEYKSHYHTILNWDRKNKKGDHNGRNKQNETDRERQQRYEQYKKLEGTGEV